LFVLLYLGYTTNHNIPLGYLLRLLVERCQGPFSQLPSFSTRNVETRRLWIRIHHSWRRWWRRQGVNKYHNILLSLVVTVMAQWAQQLPRQNHRLSMCTGYYRCWNFQTWEFFPQLPKYQALNISFHIKWIIFYLTCIACFYVL